MTSKVCGWLHCPPTQKLLIAAELVGLKVEFQAVEGCSNFKFITPEGVELCSLAGLRYLGRIRPDMGLYGRTFLEMGQVDCAFEFVTSEITLALQAWVSCKADTGCVQKIRAELVAALEKRVEPVLLKQTFLVGERMTIADIHLAASLNYALTCDVDILKTLPNIARWMVLISNHPVVKKHLSAGHDKCSIGSAAKSETKKAEKKEDKKVDKKEEKKVDKKEERSAAEIEDAIEAEAKAKAKKQNALDLLPSTAFVLDAWKREYSNTKDLLGVAMPWFWKNLDPAGWSVWYMRYEKMEGENTVGFTTANMLGGFLQRLDSNFRKYSFAVINVVGETGDFDIQGVWFIRGSEIPFELKDHPSFEYYKFRKLDFTTDKALIEEYWCNEEKAEGRPISSCKVWK